MATFSPLTCEISLASGGQYQGSRADLANIPSDPAATMSFAHEYIHYLQLISSYYGFALICQTINNGIYAALILSQTASKQQTVSGYYDIFGMLESLPNGAGVADADVQAMKKTLEDELRALLLPQSHAYNGDKVAWEIDELTVVSGTFSEPLIGFITPSGRFRPFTPGLLSEGMARRIDQWLKQSQGFTSHSWGGTPESDEIYDGIKTVLLQPRYSHHITDQTVDKLTVIVCALALASNRPDHAMYFMLQRLESPVASGILAQAIEQEFREILRGKGLLSATAFNKLLDDFQHGPAKLIRRDQYIPIYDHLCRVHLATNRVLGSLGSLAKDDFNWNDLRRMMTEFVVPTVIANDGPVSEVDGIATDTTLSSLLKHVWRVAG